jgi:hypothetical protein
MINYNRASKFKFFPNHPLLRYLRIRGLTIVKSRASNLRPKLDSKFRILPESGPNYVKKADLRPETNLGWTPLLKSIFLMSNTHSISPSTKKKSQKLILWEFFREHWQIESNWWIILYLFNPFWLIDVNP